MEDTYRRYREGLKQGKAHHHVVYKYQTFQDYSVNALKNNTIKFSSNAELNDPFDLMTRIDYPYHPKVGDIMKLIERVKQEEGASYQPPILKGDVKSYEALLKWSDENEHRLFRDAAVNAASINDEYMLGLLSNVKAEYQWCGEYLSFTINRLAIIAGMAKTWCTTFSPADLLMWGYYANGFKGFCIGYICHLGVNPGLLLSVRYKGRIKPINPVEAALNSGDAYWDLVLTKPSKWKHERELRWVMGQTEVENDGIQQSMFPIHKLIVGHRIPKAKRKQLFDAVANQPVSLWEAVPKIHKGHYTVMFKNLSGEVPESSNLSYSDFNKL